MNVGDIIWFGRKYGEKTKAKIVKVNSKTVKVRLEEHRGIGRGCAVGAVWSVAKTLCHDKNGMTLEIPQTRREHRQPRTLPPLVSQALDKLTNEERIAVIEFFATIR